MSSVSRLPHLPIHRAGWAVLLGLVMLMLATCQAPPATPEPETLTIAWVPKSLGNPVFDLGLRGAQARAQELSATGPITVELVVVGPASADAVEQARLIDDLIARGVDGIAVSCNEPTACADPIDRAAAAGIPVMTWDSDSPDSGRFTFLSIDNYAAGQRAADLLSEAIGGAGEVAILTGAPGALNLEERVAGFRDQLTSAYPDIEIVRVVASHEDITVGVQGVEETMQAHPNLDGWFFAGMWPLFADRDSMPLWESAARQGTLKTVAFDALPLELDLLRDGYLEALIGQKYWRWGYDSVDIVYNHVLYGNVYPSVIDTGMDIVTRNNVEAMAEMWESNDFSQPLPAP